MLAYCASQVDSTLSGWVKFLHDSPSPHKTGRHRRYHDGVFRDKHRWEDRSIVLLVRHPIATAVSLWFHDTHRLKRNVGTLRDFLFSPDGLELSVLWLNDWALNRDVPRRVMILRYEKVLTSPAECVGSLLNWISPEVEVEKWPEEAAELCSFRSMQEHERRFVTPITNQRGSVKIDPREVEARAVREGSAEGYRRMLDEELLREAQDYVSKNLSVVYAYTK
jgi:hypothetical protein